MARAYLVLARKDMEDNNLQILDLWPNSSLRNTSIDPAGQTGYLGFTAQSDTVTLATPVAVDIFVGDTYGLAAYIADNVEDMVGNLACTAAKANAAATALLTIAAAGTALTETTINASLAADLSAGSVLATAPSTGTVAEVLRIISGEVYKVADGAIISGAAHAFAVHTRKGSFVASTDSHYRSVRTFIDTGALHISRDVGALSKFCSTAYVWNNGTLTYGVGGTALFLDSTAIPTTHLGAAIVVYDASGNVITN